MKMKKKDINSIFNVDAKKIIKNSKLKKEKKTIEELVNSFIKSNDKNALTPLYSKYCFGLKMYALKFVKDPYKADEMVLTAFEKAWANKDKFNPEKAKFCTWLYTICKNICLADLYEKKRENIIPTDIHDLFNLSEDNVNSNEKAESAKDQFIVNKENEIEMLSKDMVIKKFYDVSLGEINKLDDRTSTILTEKLINNKKIKDISIKYNYNMSTVKNLLYKGKEKIKESLIKNHNDLYNMYLDAISDTKS